MSIKKGAMTLLFLLIPFVSYAVPITYTADMLKPIPKCNIVFKATPPKKQTPNNNQGVGYIYPPHPINPPAPVPEPTTMLLVGSGMVSIATLRKFFKS